MQVEGVRFQGKFGLVALRPDGTSLLIGSAAATLKRGAFGFADDPARWTGGVKQLAGSVLTTDTPAPGDLPPIADGTQNYVLLATGPLVTGYRVAAIDRDRITVSRFAPREAERFDLPILRVVSP